MRYVIYGTGAIGGGIGARLVEGGHEVVFIARGGQLEAMRRDGLRVRTPTEDFHVEVDAVGHPSEVRWSGEETVLLAVKSQHTIPALEDLRAAAGTEVAVVCAQNGVENERQAARRFARVYAMLVQMPATYLVPGEVLVNGEDVSGVLPVGRYPHGTDEVAEEIAAALAGCHFRSWAEPAVMRLKYAKLLYINLDNAIQAACPAGEETSGLLALALAEGEAAVAAAGIESAPEPEFQERRRMIYGKIDGAERIVGGSTWQSLERGAGSIETDYLNGEIVLLGKLHGVPTPVNRALQDVTARMLHEGRPTRSVPVAEVLDLARRYGAAV